MFDYNDKIVVVTGAARGIGKNIAFKFASLGAKVVIVDINEQLADDIREEAILKKLDINFFPADLTTNRESELLIDRIIKRNGNIDILINNAKAGKRTPPLSETIENCELTLEISLKAPLFISQALISRKITSSKKGGIILNISSVASKTICQESASYHLAKAALESLTRYLAVYGGPKGFRVNAISPGFIVQDEHQERYWQDDNKQYRNLVESCHPLRNIGYSDDVANATIFLCSDMAKFITGQVLKIDGGLTIQDQWNLVYKLQQTQNG